MKKGAILLLDQYGTLHLKLPMRLVTDMKNLLTDKSWYSKNKSNYLFLKKVHKSYKDDIKYLQTSKANYDFVRINKYIKDKDELIKSLTSYNGHESDDFIFWLEIRVQTKDKRGNYYQTRYFKDNEKSKIESIVDLILDGKEQNTILTTDYHASILPNKTIRFNSSKSKTFTSIKFSTEEILDRMVKDWTEQYNGKTGGDYDCEHLCLIRDLYKKCREIDGNKLLEFKDFNFYD